MSDTNQVAGRNIGRLRLAHKISASKLARRAGVSKATILALEMGRANPTVDTLEAIAGALSVSLVDLLTDPANNPVTTVKRAADATWHPQGTMSIRPLESLYGVDLVYVFVARVDERGYRADGHEADSFESLYVLDGTILAGPVDQPVELGPADFIRFTADRPHMYRAREGTARILAVSRNHPIDTDSA